MMNWLVKIFALSVVAGTLAALPMTPANADQNDSGSRNCDGNGHIVMVAGYQPFFGVNVAVKQAGPPSGPTWGATIPADELTWIEALRLVAWVSPYQEGTWNAHTEGPWLQAGTQCSIKPLRDGSPDVTRSLGDKECADKNVWVFVDSGAEIWISYRSNEDSRYKRIHLERVGNYPLNDLNTREESIYDVVVRIYGGDSLNAAGMKCGSSL